MEDAFGRLGRVSNKAAAVRGLTDTSVTQVLWQLGEVRRQTDAMIALVAGEITSRWRRHPPSGDVVNDWCDTFHRDPTTVVQEITGSTRSEAERYVEVGEVIVEAEQAIDARATVEALGLPIEVEDSWLGLLGVAVAAEGLSVASAHAVMHGLADPDGSAHESALEAAARQLAAEAHGVVPEELYRRARAVRRQLEGEVELFGSDLVTHIGGGGGEPAHSARRRAS